MVTQQLDNFGFSVSISSNGSIVAVGAPLNNDNGVDSGHVKVYQFNGLFLASVREQILMRESESDQLGFSVSLSSNGDYNLPTSPPANRS